MHVTIQQLLETTFSMQPVPRVYSEDDRGKLVSCSHELVVRW
jgi:hypothetical protein